MHAPCPALPRAAHAALLSAGAFALCALAGPLLGQAPPATDLYLAPLEAHAGVVHVGRATPITNRDGYDNEPSFTPDGTAILYTSIDATGQADVYRYDLQTRRTSRLTRTAPESEYSAMVMPGGHRFSVVRVEADSTQRLWSFDLSGGDPRLLVPGLKPVGYYAWADAHTLAVYVLGPPATLHVVDVATGADRTVARGIGRSIQRIPGRHAVSFVQELGGGRTRIAALSLTDDSIVPLVVAPDGGDFHAWTPDGTLLMAHGSQLLAWRPGATGWRVVADLAGSGVHGITRLAVSPDGRHLAIVGRHPTGARH